MFHILLILRIIETVLLLSVALTITTTTTNCQAQEFNIALWGDLPYYGRSVNIFDPKDDYGLKYQALRNSINNHKFYQNQFAIHTGDIKSGNTPCIELYYDRFRQLSNSLQMPSLLSLGDNEWTDCYRASPKGYNDPLKQLQYLRNTFFDNNNSNSDNNGKQYSIMGSGGSPIQLSSFGIDPFIENQYFIYNNILFSTLHVVGTNNNKHKNCDRRLNSVDPGCNKANREFEARENAVVESIQKLFRLAKQQSIRGIMIVIQAHFWGGNTQYCNNLKLSVHNATSTVSSGYQKIVQTLLDEVIQYNNIGSVVIVHGDAHYYRYCNPTIYKNIAFVMVPGSSKIHWVLSTIDSTRNNIQDIFQFQSIQPPPVVNTGDGGGSGTKPMISPPVAPIVKPSPIRVPMQPQPPVVVPRMVPASSPDGTTSGDDDSKCSIRYKMYNARTDSYVGQINYGKLFEKPPCNMNIEIVIRCATSTNMQQQQRISRQAIRITLRRLTKDTNEIIYARTEFDTPYFVFGNHRISTTNDKNSNSGYRNDVALEIGTEQQQQQLLLIDIRAIANRTLDEMLPPFGWQFRLEQCVN